LYDRIWTTDSVLYNLGRSTWERMSRRLDSKLWYSLFHLWM